MSEYRQDGNPDETSEEILSCFDDQVNLDMGPSKIGHHGRCPRLVPTLGMAPEEIGHPRIYSVVGLTGTVYPRISWDVWSPRLS